MALYASVALIGAITVLIIVFAAMYVGARREVEGQDATASTGRSTHAPSQDTASMWSSLVGSLDDPVRPIQAEDVPAWKLHAEAARAGDPGVYKTRHASSPRHGERWDPYAESQSTASRAKAARRKPRPHRSPPPPAPLNVQVGEADPYALLAVSRVASTEEIERAYRRQVSTFHPDKFHDDPAGRQHAHEKLKQLNAAMKVLRDRRG
jgi:DnaJ-domain-containing protein 1